MKWMDIVVRFMVVAFERYRTDSLGAAITALADLFAPGVQGGGNDCASCDVMQGERIRTFTDPGGGAPAEWRSH